MDGGATVRTGQRTARSPRASVRTAPQSRDYPLQISFLEAYQGTERTLQIDDRRLQVKIPAGAHSGTRVRLQDVGPSNVIGQKSDIYLVVEVASDARFERKGDDLYTDITLDLFTAVLGGQVNVQTPGGNVLLTIPPGTQPGQTFRLGGRGMPHLRSPQEHGDLFARARVTLPRRSFQPAARPV